MEPFLVTISSYHHSTPPRTLHHPRYIHIMSADLDDLSETFNSLEESIDQLSKPNTATLSDRGSHIQTARQICDKIYAELYNDDTQRPLDLKPSHSHTSIAEAISHIQKALPTLTEEFTRFWTSKSDSKSRYLGDRKRMYDSLTSVRQAVRYLVVDQNQRELLLSSAGGDAAAVPQHLPVFLTDRVILHSKESRSESEVEAALAAEGNSSLGTTAGWPAPSDPSTRPIQPTQETAPYTHVSVADEQGQGRHVLNRTNPPFWQ